MYIHKQYKKKKSTKGKKTGSEKERIRKKGRGKTHYKKEIEREKILTDLRCFFMCNGLGNGCLCFLSNVLHMVVASLPYQYCLSNVLWREGIMVSYDYPVYMYEGEKRDTDLGKKKIKLLLKRRYQRIKKSQKQMHSNKKNKKQKRHIGHYYTYQCICGKLI